MIYCYLSVTWKEISPEQKGTKMDEILQIIDKARNLPMDHEPNVSDMWDMINAIEKIAQDNLNDVIPPWQREGKDE